MKKKKQDKEWKDKTIGLGVWSMRMWKKGYEQGKADERKKMIKEIGKFYRADDIGQIWIMIEKLKAKLRGKK